MNLLDEVLWVCRNIRSERNAYSVYGHMCSEVDELDEEMERKMHGEAAGEDGVLGEAVDVILCAIDLIYQNDPTVTNLQIMNVVDRKLNKWISKYGN